MNWCRILSIGLIAFFGGSLSACGGWGHSAEEHLERAKQELAKKEISDAVIELKSALQQDPSYVAARVLLGEAYLQLGDFQSAEKEFERARELGASDPNLLPSLGMAWLKQWKLDPLLELEIPATLGPEPRARLLALRGEALLAKRNEDEAEKLFVQALETDPESLPAMLGQARLSAARGDLKQAHEWIDRIQALDGNWAPAWSLSGDVAELEGNREAAIEAYSRAIGLRLDNTVDLLKRAYVRVATGHYDEARADVQHLKKLVENDLQVDFLDGLLLLQQRNYADAQQTFESILAYNDKYLPAIFFAGMTHLYQKNYTWAEDYLRRYVAGNPNDASANKILAALSLRVGDYAKTEQLAAATIAENSQDIVAINLMALTLIGQDKTAEGVDYLQQVVAIQPDSPQAHARLGEGLIAEGKRADGIAELEKAWALNPDDEKVVLKLILAHLTNKSPDKALQVAREFRDRQPESVSAYLMLGTVYMTRKEVPEASQAFEKALTFDPGNLAANTSLADIALQSKDMEKAKQFYRDALKAHPGDVKTLINLAMVEVAQGNSEAMESALGEAIAADPKALEPRLYLARYYLKSGDVAKAMSVLSKVQDDFEDNPKFLILLAQVELASGDYATARSSLTRLDALQPDNATIHFLLSKAYAGLGDREKVRAELAQAVELAPNHALSRIALANLMIQEKEVDEAGTQIRALKAMLGEENQEVLTLEGQLAELRGDTSAAISAYQKAFALVETRGNLLRLAEMRLAAGESEQVVADLQTWLQAHPEDALTQLRLAQIYLGLQREDQAIQAFTGVVEKAPESVFALNNLAWLLREREPAKALEYAERANALAPEAWSVLDTFAVVLLKNGDTDSATRMIERALEKSPDQPTLVFHSAMILEAAGRREEAIVALKTILGQGQAFPESAQAENLLKEINGVRRDR